MQVSWNDREQTGLKQAKTGGASHRIFNADDQGGRQSEPLRICHACDKGCGSVLQAI